MLWKLHQYWVLAHRASLRGSTETIITARHWAYFQRLIWPSVHMAAGEPVSSAKVPLAIALWAPCPAAVRALTCAVVNHAANSRCSPQSRLAPSLLGVLPKSRYIRKAALAASNNQIVKGSRHWPAQVPVSARISLLPSRQALA